METFAPFALLLIGPLLAAAKWRERRAARLAARSASEA